MLTVKFCRKGKSREQPDASASGSVKVVGSRKGAVGSFAMAPVVVRKVSSSPNAEKECLALHTCSLVCNAFDVEPI